MIKFKVNGEILEFDMAKVGQYPEDEDFEFICGVKIIEEDI